MSPRPVDPKPLQVRPACMGSEQGDTPLRGRAVSSNRRRDQRSPPPSAQKRRSDDSDDPAAKREKNFDSSAEESKMLQSPK